MDNLTSFTIFEGFSIVWGNFTSILSYFDPEIDLKSQNNPNNGGKCYILLWYTFSAISHRINWRKWLKILKNGHFWGFGRNIELFWPLPVTGNEILFYINLLPNQGNNLQKIAYKNLFQFSQYKRTEIPNLYLKG